MNLNRSTMIVNVLMSLALYGAALVVSLIGLPVVKSIVTGTAGPNTHFVATVIVCPVVFGGLGLIGGRRVFLGHVLLVIVTALWAWMTFPQNPPMNFMRQIAHDLPPALIVMYVVGGVLTVMKSKRARHQKSKLRDRLPSILT